MSVSKSVGRAVMWLAVLYLVVQGAIVFRPARMVAALSSLAASLFKTEIAVQTEPQAATSQLAPSNETHQSRAGPRSR